MRHHFLTPVKVITCLVVATKSPRKELIETRESTGSTSSSSLVYLLVSVVILIAASLLLLFSIKVMHRSQKSSSHKLDEDSSQLTPHKSTINTIMLTESNRLKRIECGSDVSSKSPPPFRPTLEANFQRCNDWHTDQTPSINLSSNLTSIHTVNQHPIDVKAYLEHNQSPTFSSPSTGNWCNCPEANCITRWHFTCSGLKPIDHQFEASTSPIINRDQKNERLPSYRVQYTNTLANGRAPLECNQVMPHHLYQLEVKRDQGTGTSNSEVDTEPSTCLTPTKVDPLIGLAKFRRAPSPTHSADKFDVVVVDGGTASPYAQVSIFSSSPTSDNWSARSG